MTSAEERLARFKEAKKKAEESKNNNFDYGELPKFECCILKKDTPKIIRILGETPEMRKSKTDALKIRKSVCIDDDKNYNSVIWSDDSNHPWNLLTKEIIGKYTVDKEDKKIRHYENKGKPSFERFMTNDKPVAERGPFEHGMMPDYYTLMNVIDKTDDWCKTNKHSKMLCWDCKSKEVDGETRTYPTYGAKTSLYKTIFDEKCTTLNRHPNDVDFVVKRLSKKQGESWCTICTPEEKTVITNMGLDSNKVTMDYLTEEEENYGMYELENIPFISKPTSCTYILKHFAKLIKQADIDFHNGEPINYNRFVEASEKEKLEWEEEKKNKEENGETTSNEVTETVTNESPSYENMKNVEVESEDLPTEVEKEIVETPTVKKVAKVIKSSFDVMNYVNKFSAISKLNDEEKSLIVGFDETKNQFIFKEGIDMATCPSCKDRGVEVPDGEDGMDIPDAFTVCPYCGQQFC